MRSFLCLLLCLPALSAVAQEDVQAVTTAPLLSAGGGFGTHVDASSVGAQVNVALAYWVTPQWTIDVQGAVYPILAPSIGPMVHLPLFETAAVNHVALIGLSAGVLTRFAADEGPHTVDPTLAAQVGYGLQTDDLDVRCTVALARDMRNLASPDYFATVQLSLAKIIHSSSPEY